MRSLAFFLLAAGFVAVIGAYLYFSYLAPRPPEGPPVGHLPMNGEKADDDVPRITVIAENLNIPWDFAFLPEGGMLVTERDGRLLSIGADTEIHEIPIENVRRTGEGGLLGIVLHPQFERNKYLYLYFTTPGEDGETTNRIERYRFENNALSERKVIIDTIPGAIYHDGGRMEFGPDGMLYVTTGDATRENIAQDRDSLGGKILRLRDDGSIPGDNPFGTAVYSYGHRNPQGLAWDASGQLWETEHGRSGVLSGYDEVNLIERGKNYGWPEIEGDETRAGVESPKRHSGANDTWAPASAAILGSSLFFGGLRGEALYEAVLSGMRVTGLTEHFKGEFGRIRTVRVGPDGMLYVTTSNRDGRGTPETNDDKIIRINPAKL